jgi:hypothetical protein
VPRNGYHRTGTIIMSSLMVVIGVTIVIRTLDGGGGALAVGMIMGMLFVLAGAGRLWVALKQGED